jgi:DNA polymerase-1
MGAPVITPGLPLVVLPSPTRDEAHSGRSFSSHSSVYVRRLAERICPDGVNLTYAIGCSVGKSPETDTIEKCRPYLLNDIEQSKPSRIILIGNHAIQSAFGRYVDATYLRHAWGMVRGIPAFILGDHTVSIRNRFIRITFERDLAWALTSELPVQPAGVTLVPDPIEAAQRLCDIHWDYKYKGPTTPGNLVVDVEHAGSLWGRDFALLCVGIGHGGCAPLVLSREALGTPVVQRAFKALMEDHRVPKVNVNVKHDRHAIYRQFGVDIKGVERDLMLWARLREPEALSGLGPLSWLVGFGGYKEAAKSGEDDEDAKGGARFAKMPVDKLHAYNGRDIAATTRLDAWMTKAMPEALKLTWSKLIGPAFEMLGHVERNGMALSPDNVRAYDMFLENKLNQCIQSLAAIPEVPREWLLPRPGSTKKAPHEIKITPNEIAQLLYEKLNLPVMSKTATGKPSTDAATLEALKTSHPAVALLLDFAGIKKQRSTYGLGMLKHMSVLDGRVHTTFKIVRTGRLSSSGPNMQNITRPDVEGDEGSWARGCFIAPHGKKLVSLDYSQQELRVAAMLSGDVAMAKAFESGEDFHKATAALAFNTPIAQVTKTQRSAAKAVNFGLIFGQGSYALGKSLGMSTDAAQNIIDKILGKYAGLAKWRRDQEAQGTVSGVLRWSWNPPGSGLDWTFRRSAYGLGQEGSTKEDEKIRRHWVNVSQNTPIQGIANCFCLASLVEIVRWTLDEEPKTKVVMTVHDSIVLEVPDADVLRVAAEAKRLMLRWPSGGVPMAVDVEVGDDWGHLKSLPV